jgi:hypothetical protein
MTRSPADEPSETLTDMSAERLDGFFGRYRSAGRRASITCILLGVVGFFALLSMIQAGSGVRIVDDLRAGVLSPKEARDFQDSTVFAGLEYLGAALATAIAYLAWLSRTVDNVPELRGGRPLVTPRWSIGWWFIPFANLVKPYQIVRDIHDRMATNVSSGGGWIVLAWWVSWVLGAVISQVATWVPAPTSPDPMSTLFSIQELGYGLALLGAILAIVVVLRIQWRADERADSVGVGLAGGRRWRQIPR